MIPAETGRAGRDTTVTPRPLPHLTVDETDPWRRGRTTGRAFRERIRAGLTAYRDLFTAVRVDPADLRPYGEAALAATERWAPRLHRELIGTAAGAETEPWHIGLLNARTEVLATVGATAEGECSTAVWVGGGGAPHTIQTWDWHAEFADARTLAALRTESGRTVRTFTEAGILAKIGLNSGGLGLHFNILSHRDDGAGIGVPVHLVARRVLEEATTVAEARDIAASAAVSASTVLTVVAHDGGRGDAGCVELSPAGTALIRPDSDGVLVHTNHFLDPVLAGGEQAAPTASTFPRHRRLMARQALLKDDDPRRWTELMLSHEADGAPICCHPQPGLPSHQQWSTLLTVSLDFVAGRLRYHSGGPCTAGADAWQWF
ncbi:C45 family autoproteolytic acyltransferase/hydrolase [Streptomyces sp. NPDC055078]